MCNSAKNIAKSKCVHGDVESEGSIICLVYNLKRLMNFQGVRELARRFKANIFTYSIILKVIHKSHYKHLVIEHS